MKNKKMLIIILILNFTCAQIINTNGKNDYSLKYQYLASFNLGLDLKKDISALKEGLSTFGNNELSDFKLDEYRFYKQRVISDFEAYSVFYSLNHFFRRKSVFSISDQRIISKDEFKNKIISTEDGLLKKELIKLYFESFEHEDDFIYLKTFNKKGKCEFTFYQCIPIFDNKYKMKKFIITYSIVEHDLLFKYQFVEQIELNDLKKFRELKI